MRTYYIVAAVVLSSGVFGQSSDSSRADWRFAYPDGAVRVSVYLGRVLRSSMVTDAMNGAFASTALAASRLAPPQGAAAGSALPGQSKDMASAIQLQAGMMLKMLQGIDQVQLSIRQTDAGKDSDMLMLIRGQIDPGLRKMITQQSSGKPMSSRQIAPDVLLVGSTAHLPAAANRMAGTAKTSAPDSFSDSDLWISGDAAMLASLAKTSPATGSATLPGINDLKRFTIGVNLRDPFDLNIDLVSASDEAATKLYGLYTLAMAANAGRTPDEFSPLADRIHVEKQGSALQFRFSAPVAMLQAALAKSQAMRGAAGTAGIPSALGNLFGVGSATPSATPSPSYSVTPSSALRPSENPGKIMIYGLEGGPHEVGAPTKK